ESALRTRRSRRFRLSANRLAGAVQGDDLAAQPALGLLVIAEHAVGMFRYPLEPQYAIRFCRGEMFVVFLAPRQGSARSHDRVEFVVAESPVLQRFDPAVW